MHPSDEELKQIEIKPLVTKKQKRHDVKNGNAGELNSFHVPKQNNLQLETTKVTLSDVIQLRFYSEYQWLLDFAFYAFFVYFITEAYISFFPSKSSQEVNLSMVWCALAVGFAYKILISLTGSYFKNFVFQFLKLFFFQLCISKVKKPEKDLWSFVWDLPTFFWPC